MANFGHFASPGGICKIIGIILGLVILGLESHAYDETKDFLKIFSMIDGINWSEGLEATLIAFTVICLLGTGLLLIFRALKESDMLKKIDMGFHAFGALALLIGAICLFYAATHIDSKLDCGGLIGLPIPEKECRKTFKFFHKISAASIAVLDALIYIVIAVMAKRGK